MLRQARNIAIIFGLAAVVVFVPGGGQGSSIVLQVVWLAFLATLFWFAMISYRQHRVSLYALGDRRRAVLYGAVAVATLTLTGTARLWSTGAGSVVWLVLLAAAVYTVIAVAWSARRY